MARKSLRKRLRPYLPNTSDRLALVSLDDSKRFGAYWPMRLTQIVGGKRWSLSLTWFKTPHPITVAPERDDPFTPEQEAEARRAVREVMDRLPRPPHPRRG